MTYTGAKAESHYDNSHVYLMDCMDALRQTPDKFYDLAVVDPVFGEQVVQGGYMQNSSSKMAKNKQYNNNIWKQQKTDQLYFEELFRISKNQVVWGGNYFISQIKINTSCFIVWDKENGENHYADCELAWTSFNTATRKFKFRWQGMLQGNMKNKENRIHPTQKPVALYDWIYHNYLPNGGKVIDTHLGSGSNRIAADKARNIEFYGFEIDAEYYEAQEKRYKIFKAQKTLF